MLAPAEYQQFMSGSCRRVARARWKKMQRSIEGMALMVYAGRMMESIDRHNQARAYPLLALRNVSRSFIQKGSFFSAIRLLKAVDGVSLEISPGESVGLVGESGCGKSTLGRIACGLLEPDSGEILFKGKALPVAGSASWAAGQIQMVFQDPASSLNPRLSVRNSVAEPLAARHVPQAERKRLADEMLATVGLPGFGSRLPHEFSGGQRQRIAIARALITRPALVICDEPVSALDASVQAQVLNLLRGVQEDFGPAYLFISHDLAVVGFVCSRILVMYLGQLVEIAQAEQFFASALHPYSQALLAAMPDAGATLTERRRGLCAQLAVHGELPSPLAPPAGCHFHPRCPQVMPICRSVPPAWHEAGPKWLVRCHLLDAVAGKL